MMEETKVYVDEISIRKRIKEAELVLPAANKVAQLFDEEKISFNDEHLRGFLSGSSDYLIGVLGTIAKSEIERLDVKLEKLKKSLLSDATTIDKARVERIHKEFYKAMGAAKIKPTDLEVTKSGEVRLNKSFIIETEKQFTVDFSSEPGIAEMREQMQTFVNSFNGLQDLVEKRNELSLHEILDPRYGAFFNEIPGQYPKIELDLSYFLGFNGKAGHAVNNSREIDNQTSSDPTVVKINV